jgi:hypothetical protein
MTNIETDRIESVFRIKPNPVKRSCIITVSVKESSSTKIIIYNSQGQKVRTLYNGILLAESYDFELDISELPDGLYYVSLWTNTFSETKKFIVIK